VRHFGKRCHAKRRLETKTQWIAMKTNIVSRLVFTSLILSAFLLAPACVRERSPVTGQKKAYGFSWEQERQIGKQSDVDIIKEYGLYDDPQVQAYVQRVAEGVLQTSDLRDADTPEMYRTPMTFRVLDSPIVNAFALPGGYVYVTRGLLSHVNNEAQLAVVLGHETGHVAARHAAQQALKAQVGQLGLMAGAIVGSQVFKNPETAGQLLSLTGQAFQLLMLKYSRDDERQADDLGVRYAAQRGYDASEGANFFDTLARLGQKDGVVLPSWMSTHPDPGDRKRTVIQLARQYERPLATKVEGQEELYRHLEGLIVGNDPREGFVEGNTFYHPKLRFQFPVPSGWKVKNEKAYVLMTAPDRNAIMIFENAPANSAREAAARMTQSQGLRVVQTAPERVNGLNAIAVLAEANSQQGAVGLLNYFIEYGGRVYSFMGVTPSSQLSQYNRQFQGVMSRFNRLDDPRKLNVEPSRLAIITTPRSAPFVSFVPTGSTRAGLTAEEIAILNQVHLDETIPAGARLKVPR
jgi:predicted Zn-dependent protease